MTFPFFYFLGKEGSLPIIISSARSDDTDKILALEIRADDYLAKLYNPRELVAKIQAVLRRNKPSEKVIKCDEFELHRVVIVAWIFFNILMLILYIGIIRSLYPLKILREKIKLLNERNLNVSIKT